MSDLTPLRRVQNELADVAGRFLHYASIAQLPHTLKYYLAILLGCLTLVRFRRVILMLWKTMHGAEVFEPH